MNERNGFAIRVEAIVIGASAGGVEALLKYLLGRCVKASVCRSLSCCTCPTSAAAIWLKCSPGICAAGLEATTRTPSSPARCTSPRRVITCRWSRISQLSLSQEDRVHHSRPAIDILFESAADAYGKSWRPCC
jgi:two-component system chemotaxis response regulator CheB